MTVGILALTLLLGASACSKKQPAQAKTLKVWRLYDDESLFKQQIQQFEASNDVNIEYRQFTDPATYENEVVNAIAAGQGPDVWSIRNDWIPRHFDKLTPMPEGVLVKKRSDKRTTFELYKDTFVPVVVADNVVGGKIYGMPIAVDTLMLYTNMALLQNRRRELEKTNSTAANAFLQRPPATWDEVIGAANLITKKSGETISLGGIALGASNNIPTAKDIVAALMLQRNVAMVAPDRKSATFALPVKDAAGNETRPGADALEFFASFSNAKSDHYSWNANESDAFTAFADGELGMMIDYGYRAVQLKTLRPDLVFQVTPLPQKKEATNPIDYAAYYSETVTKSSKNAQLAWKFILSTVNTNGAYLTATGKASPLIRAAGHAPAIPNRAGNRRPAKFQPLTAQTWYKGKDPVSVDNLFKSAIQDAGAGAISTREAVDRLATQVNTLLQAQTPAPQPTTVPAS